MNRSLEFRLSPEKGYFTCQGVSLIAYEDIYPAGHQGGVSIIMHGERIAANGDLRFEPTPGQWQPVPLQTRRSVDPEKDRIETSLHYPDEENHLRGFNPMVFPDCVLDYTVSVRAEGSSLLVTADLKKPVYASIWSCSRACCSENPGSWIRHRAFSRGSRQAR